MRSAARAGSSSIDYSLRIIDADAIGHDVNVPVLPIQYRVHSRVGAEASLEGRDLTYVLPALPIKVLSLVPADAADIRDGADASLGAVESLRFRTSLFQIVALALGAIAAVMALLALLPLTRRARHGRQERDDGRLPDRIVLDRVAAELERCQARGRRRRVDRRITARALAALRIVAAYAIDQRDQPEAARAGCADA